MKRFLLGCLCLTLLAGCFGCGKADLSDTSDTSDSTTADTSDTSASTTADTSPSESTTKTTPVLTLEPMTEPPIYEGLPEEPAGYPVKSLKLAGNDISRYKIILPADAIASEQTAAGELIKYIEQATGVRLETAEDSEYAIVLRGQSGGELGEEGFHIFFEGQNLVISGGRPRGVLYGAYTFLEEYVGCRFYTPSFETIHRADSIDVPANINNKQLPVFDTRYSFWYDIINSQSLKAKLKVNHDVTSEALGGGKGFTGGLVHTFDTIVPPDTYSASHPEYYNGSGQLCLTNPEVLEIAKAYVRNLLAKNPNARLITVSQNDNQRYCMCDACMALAKEEGSQMGPVLRFVNEIARDIAKDYPNVLIDTLAYQYTRKPPLITRPEPNVQIRLCSIECGFSHPLDDPGSPENAAFMEDIKAWSQLTDHLAVWDYTTNFANYNAIFPNFDVLYQNMKIFKQYGVKYLFEQGTYNTPSGEFGELKGYLLAKLLWNPDMSREEYYALMDEFLRDYYGAGWENIRAYIDFLIGRAHISRLRIFENPAMYIKGEDWQQVNEWWDNAKSLATFAQLVHVEKSYTQVLNAKMHYYKYFMGAPVSGQVEGVKERYFYFKDIYERYKSRFGLLEKETG